MCVGWQLYRGGTPTKKKKEKKTINVGNKLYSSTPFPTNPGGNIVGLFGIKMMVISFPFSLYSYLLSISKNGRPLLPKCSERRGPFTFWSFLPKFHKIFKWAMIPYSKSVTFFAPSKRVGGPLGDSTHRGAAVRPVPRGSTHLKSGPGHTGA